MQDFYLTVNWLVALALLGLGIVALYKNRKLLLNIVFALFTLTIGVWIMSSYISNDVHNSPHASVVGNYFVFLFSYVSGYLLLWFAIALAGDKRAARWLKKLTAPAVLVGVVSGSPLVVAGAKRQGGVYALQFGPLVLVYFLGLMFVLIAAMVVLRRNISRTSGDQRSHLVVLYRCMMFALPILLLTEFILPAITGWFGLTNVGILVMAIPVLGLYYSVVRLKLFNLRLAIVRSIAYALTLGIIGALYGLVSYYLTTLTRGAHDQFLRAFYNVVLIVLAVSVYPPLIRTFRKLTDRLFYRDAYDPQVLFEQLNQALAATLNLDTILNQSAEIIVENIKSQFCSFDLKATSHSPHHIIGHGKRTVGGKPLDELYAAIYKQQKQIIVTETLLQPQIGLRRLLERENIAVLIPFSLDRDSKVSGLILLGQKSSGGAYTGQDVQVLDAITNELTVAIQNAQHYEEVQNFNETLQERVDKATGQLRRTNARLRQLDETKDDFISMASHQLRTPLTSVKGYLSMVLEGDTGEISTAQRKMLQQAFNSSQQMVYLISDLLNLSRLNTGKFVIEATPVDLSEVVQAEIGQLAEIAKSRGLTLEYYKPDNFPKLMLDDTKIHQVVMNFIDNALHYTPEGGKVTVNLTETPTAVEYTVTDTGIGVPKSVQHKLFGKFYRAENAQKTRPDGTGLGLFMAKKVITAQGGSIIFHSEEDKGSTFGFRFSKARLLSETTVAPR